MSSLPPYNHERLRQLITTHAVVRGRVVLSSGKEASYYLDNRLITLSAEGAYLVARGMLDRLRERGVSIDAIGGPTLAADPIVGAVTAISFLEGAPIPGFIVRKEAKTHGMARLIEGPLPSGARVAIVDDTATTGGSLFHGIQAAETAGCTVVSVLVIVDRKEGARERVVAAGYPFEALFTVDDLDLGNA